MYFLAKKISFSAAGDALMVKMLPRNYHGLAHIADFIGKGDARLVNLETILSNFDCFPSAYSGGTWVNARPEILNELLRFGFNMFGCANNHSMDYSYDGLISTMHELGKSGVAYAGIGLGLEQASAPAQLLTESGRVMMISICSTFSDAARAGSGAGALPPRPGLNPLRVNTVYTVTPEHMRVLREIAEVTKINGERDNAVRAGFALPDVEGRFNFSGIQFQEGKIECKMTTCHPLDLSRTKADIAQALNHTDYVVVMAHSHQIKGEYYHEPDYFFETFCRACIDAGACAVIGGGTHQLKPIEIYKGKPIFYSLGNFVFQNNSVEFLPPDFMEKYGLPPDSTTEEGLNARSKNNTVGLHMDISNYRSVLPYFEMEGGCLKRLSLLPIELGFNLSVDLKGLPYVAGNEEAKNIFEQLRQISEPYNTKMLLKNHIIEVCL